MIVRDLKAAETTPRRVVSPDGAWESTRLLLAEDGMGFSFHITTIYAGKSIVLHYTNHLEAVYCISGSGQVETLSDGKVHRLAPGVIYALDQHDRHRLSAEEALVFACVFNPPLTGGEVHREDGSYGLEPVPLPLEDRPGEAQA